jgi:heterodisulfide reductase subunit B
VRLDVDSLRRPQDPVQRDCEICKMVLDYRIVEMISEFVRHKSTCGVMDLDDLRSFAIVIAGVLKAKLL